MHTGVHTLLVSNERERGLQILYHVLDLACQYARFQQNHLHGLDAEQLVALNELHKKVHPLLCQMQYGLRTKDGVGAADGEQIERNNCQLALHRWKMMTSSRAGFFDCLEEAVTYQNDINRRDAARLMGMRSARNNEALPLAEAAFISACRSLRAADPDTPPGVGPLSPEQVAILASDIIAAATMPESGRGGLSAVGMESVKVYHAAKLALDQWNLAKQRVQSMQILTADEMASCVATLQPEIRELQTAVDTSKADMLNKCGWKRKFGAPQKSAQLDDMVERQVGSERLANVQVQLELVHGDVQSVHQRLVVGDDSSKLMNRLRAAKKLHARRLLRLVDTHNTVLDSMATAIRPEGAKKLDSKDAMQAGFLDKVYWALRGRPALKVAVVVTFNEVQRRREQRGLDLEEMSLLCTALEKKATSLATMGTTVPSHIFPAAKGLNVYHLGNAAEEDAVWPAVKALRFGARRAVLAQLRQSRAMAEGLRGGVDSPVQGALADAALAEFQDYESILTEDPVSDDE